jgi:hypothetical protein
VRGFFVYVFFERSFVTPQWISRVLSPCKATGSFLCFCVCRVSCWCVLALCVCVACVSVRCTCCVGVACVCVCVCACCTVHVPCECVLPVCVRSRGPCGDCLVFVTSTRNSASIQLWPYAQTAHSAPEQQSRPSTNIH